MSTFSGGLPVAWESAGLLIGFFISLAIGSYLIRDSFLARMGQYVLIGAGLGYMAVLVWRNALWPRLFEPLIEGSISWPAWQEPALWQSWVPLLLGLLMWGGGLEMLRRPPGRMGARRILRILAVIPAAILGGVVLGVSLSGALQGTLWPQLAAALESPRAASLAAPDVSAAAGQTTWLLRIFTLLITGGVLIHLQSDRTAAGEDSRTPSQPSLLEELEGSEKVRISLNRPLVRRFWRLWEGVGRRALWLAAGVIFARLVAARLTLVLARLEYLLFEFPRNELWQFLWAAIQ